MLVEGKLKFHVLTEMKVFTDEKRGSHLYTIMPKYPHFLSVWIKFDTFLFWNILSKNWKSADQRKMVVSLYNNIMYKLNPVKMEIHRTEIYIKFNHNVRNLCKLTLSNLKIFPIEVFIPQVYLWYIFFLA